MPALKSSMPVNQLSKKMQQFEQYKQVYFIGIGGIGMSALARYFHQNGLTVGGYDKTPSPLTKQLELEGCLIHFDDLDDQLPEQFTDQTTTLVVYTPAIKQLGELNFFKKVRTLRNPSPSVPGGVRDFILKFKIL